MTRKHERNAIAAREGAWLLVALLCETVAAGAIRLAVGAWERSVAARGGR